MAALTIQDVPVGGLASLTFTACNGGGDTVAAGSKACAGWELETIFVVVRNTNAATRDVTVGALAPVTVPVTTGVSVIPVPNEGINDPSVAISYSAVTNLDIAAVRIGKGY